MCLGLLAGSGVSLVYCLQDHFYAMVFLGFVPCDWSRLVCEKWESLCGLIVAVNVFLSKSMDNTRRGLVLFPTLLYFFFFALVTMCFVCWRHELLGMHSYEREREKQEK